jgi:hypothetical protein
MPFGPRDRFKGRNTDAQLDQAYRRISPKLLGHQQQMCGMTC